jgi:regulatory protein SWI6
MAAKRKRMYNPAFSQSNGSNSPLFPPISATVTNAFTALGKASAVRMESPGPRQQGHAPMGQGLMRNEFHIQESWPPPPPSMVSEPSFLKSQSQANPDSAYASQNIMPDSQADMQEPPRKRARPATPVHDAPAEGFLHQVSAPLPPLNVDLIPNADQVRQTLLDLFVHSENESIAQLEGLSPEQIDMPLDTNGCAAIHWASSLARVNLIRALIARGSSIYRVNEAGETALIRGCFCTNNFDQSSFPQLLNLLHPTISIADNSGRTILHHIALKSGMKGRSADGRYYLQCLLEFIAKHGASSSSQRGPGPKVMNLGRFVADIVNAQDKSGDTALNIAARIGNRSIVYPLLEVGGNSSIPNRAGLKPLDFGVGGEPAPVPRGREQSWTVPPAVAQKREDIVKCKLPSTPASS